MARHAPNDIRLQEKCINVAIACTPDRVRSIRPRSTLTGLAQYRLNRIVAPPPINRDALYIYLHECAHFTLGHDRKRIPVYVAEFEAEQWAHQKMREHGIPVPREMTRRAKEYVAWKITKARRRGAKRIDSRALSYAKGYR